MPPTTNHLYLRGKHGVFMLPKVRAAKDAMGWEARAGYRGKPLEGSLKVTVALFWDDKRKHDVDNIKSLLDALTGIVWLDDGQIEDLHTRKFYDKETPRVELVIEECANGTSAAAS